MPWSKQVLGSPPRAPKLAPGGRRAQRESELRTRSGSWGPALCKGRLEGPVLQNTVQGSRTPPAWGAYLGGPSLPRLHHPLATPKEGTGGGAHLARGASRGLAPLLDLEPDLCPRLLREAWPHPNCPSYGRQSFGREAPLPGAKRGQSGLPGTLGSPSPSPAGRPLGDLTGGGRKAQAGGPEGGWLAPGCVEAPGHPSQDRWGWEPRPRSCRDVGGLPFFSGKVGLSMSLSCQA